VERVERFHALLDAAPVLALAREFAHFLSHARHLEPELAALGGEPRRLGLYRGPGRRIRPLATFAGLLQLRDVGGGRRGHVDAEPVGACPAAGLRQLDTGLRHDRVIEVRRLAALAVTEEIADLGDTGALVGPLLEA